MCVGVLALLLLIRSADATDLLLTSAISYLLGMLSLVLDMRRWVVLIPLELRWGACSATWLLRDGSVPFGRSCDTTFVREMLWHLW